MKIEIIEPKEKFIPIVITLENEEEASLLWHLTNCGISKTITVYSEEEKLGVNDIGDFKDRLWDGISHFYRPKMWEEMERN